MTQDKSRPRTYNQVHVPRKYTAEKRRFSIYWTWSYPWEANRDITEMDNRFSKITEVSPRGVAQVRVNRVLGKDVSYRELPEH